MSAQTAQVDHEADTAVGRRVHMLMWDRQLKQTELAPRLGIEQSALSKKLRGIRPWSLDEVVSVARELRTSVAYLIGEVDDETWCTPRDLNPEPTVSGPRAHLAEVIRLRPSAA